jgi:hypothetical protein
MTFRRSLLLALTLQLPALLWSQATQRVDLIVTGGTVVTMNEARAVYEDGAIVVKGDTIVAVGPRSELCCLANC